MWDLRFQNCLRLTPETSTMLVLSVMGVSWCGRSGRFVHSGWAKRVRFSYRANSRSSLGGVFPSVSAWLVKVLAAAFSLLETVLESRCLISNR
jgi:hypothetical protein